MRHMLRLIVVTIAFPALAEAGPPLICHPFQTQAAKLLPWGSGPGWNTPAKNYDRERLVADTLELLDSNPAILSRMENLRRAVIYATADHHVAEQLLAALMARAATPNPHRLALFDAGYLVESYKQAAHMFGRKMTNSDGYAMVVRAIDMGAPSAEMEFAAALMTEGARSAAHLQRARRSASERSLLARNIANIGR